MIDSGIMDPEEAKALLLRKGVIPPDMERGLDYVETDIEGFKVNWEQEGGYVVLDHHGQIIYDGQKGYTIPYKSSLPRAEKAVRASQSEDSITEAPEVEPEGENDGSSNGSAGSVGDSG